MIQLFQTHDIVMFGEVHGNEQEYEWLCRLVKTPGFADHVDDIVVEFGNTLYQKTVDRYVAGEDVPFDEVQKAWRDMVADAEPVSPVYGWLYKAVREANLQHPGKRGIRLLMGSPPGDWSKIRNSADLAPYEGEREKWYAEVVKTEVLAKHRRALLIMGAGHFLRGHDQAMRFELAAQQHRDVQLDKAHLGPAISRENFALPAQILISSSSEQMWSTTAEMWTGASIRGRRPSSRRFQETGWARFRRNRSSQGAVRRQYRSLLPIKQTPCCTSPLVVHCGHSTYRMPNWMARPTNER